MPLGYRFFCGLAIILDLVRPDPMGAAQIRPAPDRRCRSRCGGVCRGFASPVLVVPGRTSARSGTGSRPDRSGGHRPKVNVVWPPGYKVLRTST